MVGITGRTLEAKIDFTVRDIEDSSITPIQIKQGDRGVITGKGDYPEGKAFEININGEEIFTYRISSEYWQVIH